MSIKFHSVLIEPDISKGMNEIATPVPTALPMAAIVSPVLEMSGLIYFLSFTGNKVVFTEKFA